MSEVSGNRTFRELRTNAKGGSINGGAFSLPKGAAYRSAQSPSQAHVVFRECLLLYRIEGVQSVRFLVGPHAPIHRRQETQCTAFQEPKQVELPKLVNVQSHQASRGRMGQQRIS